MKVYIGFILVCLIGLGVTDSLLRTDLAGHSYPDLQRQLYDARRVLGRAARELRGQVFGTLSPVEKRQAEGRYAAARAYYDAVVREYLRRAGVSAIALFMAFISLLVFLFSLRRWFKDRAGALILANGSVEVLTTETVSDSKERYESAKDVLFPSKSAAIHYLRKAAAKHCAYCDARNDGRLLGQVWKRRFRLEQKDSVKHGPKLGTHWAANLAPITACPKCGKL